MGPPPPTPTDSCDLAVSRITSARNGVNPSAVSPSASTTPKVTAPTMDTNRLAKELREIQSDTKSGVTVEVLGDNLAHMQGTLKGESRPSLVSSAAQGRSAVKGRPRSDPRAPAALDRRPPISRSHLTNSSFDAGPEESPYEGGKFYVSPTPPRIAPHRPARNESPAPRAFFAGPPDPPPAPLRLSCR